MKTPVGDSRRADIPGDLLDEAKSFRETMVEDIAECDDKLMDKYLEGGDLEADELKAGLRKGVLTGDLVPVMCGSAAKAIGIRPLMDVLANYLPSPVDRGPLKGKAPKTATPRRGSRTRRHPFRLSFSRLLPTRMLASSRFSAFSPVP